MAISVSGFPALKDNYMWFLHDGEKKRSVLMDPGEEAGFLEAIDRFKAPPDLILVTHGHADHVAAIPALLEKFPCRLIGPENMETADPSSLQPGLSSMPAPDVKLNEVLEGGQKIDVLGETVHVIATPGHSNDHICFYFPDSGFVFTGDTLFINGCGRMFSGPASLYWQSMQALRMLPDETRVCSGHNYTLANIEFAATIEPEREDLKARLQQWQEKDKEGDLPIMSTIGDEKEFNPFFRTDDKKLQAIFGLEDPVALFAELRKRKDDFSPGIAG